MNAREETLEAAFDGTQHQCDVNGPLGRNRSQGFTPSPNSAQHFKGRMAGFDSPCPWGWK